MSEPVQTDAEEADAKAIVFRADFNQLVEKISIGYVGRERWKPDIEGEQRNRNREDGVTEENQPFQGSVALRFDFKQWTGGILGFGQRTGGFVSATLRRIHLVSLLMSYKHLLSKSRVIVT
jgi:hypothetical protein